MNKELPPANGLPISRRPANPKTMKIARIPTPEAVGLIGMLDGMKQKFHLLQPAYRF